MLLPRSSLRPDKPEKFGTQLTSKSIWASEIALQPKPPKATSLSGLLCHAKTSVIESSSLQKVMAVATASQTEQGLQQRWLPLLGNCFTVEALSRNWHVD